MVNWRTLKSQIPNRVQVSNKIFYEICWIEAFQDPETVGETRFDTRQIVLKLDQSPKESVLTYLHELAHAISAEYDLNLTETQIKLLENSLYYVLKAENVFKGKKNE